MAEGAGADGRLNGGDRTARPWTVTWALILVAVVVGTLLVGVAQSIEATVRVQGLLSRAAEVADATPSQVARERTADAVTGIAVTAAQVVLAAALMALTIWVWRGHHPARITLCTVAGFLSTSCAVFAVPRPSTGVSGQLPFLMERDRLAAATQPAWESALALPARIVVIGLPLLALALMTMPASNRFFRQQHAASRPSGPRPVR